MSSLELILNSATAYGAPGGANAARVQNDVGDLCLWSSNNVGMRISAVSGYVGVGKTASYALDVSGSVNATGLYGCITDSLTVPISTLAASAYGLSNVFAVAGAALPRAGGTVTGALTVLGSLYASNVTVMGSTEVINAYETHSSNLVITNLGTGPALTVTQTEGGTAQPVAAFYAGIGAANPALMVTNAGQVGIGKATAGYALDVSGGVNATFYSGGFPMVNYAFYMSANYTGTGTVVGSSASTVYTSQCIDSSSSSLNNLSNGILTCPFSGVYICSIYGNINTGTLINLCVNGNPVLQSFPCVASLTSVSQTFSVYATAGSTICYKMATGTFGGYGVITYALAL